MRNISIVKEGDTFSLIARRNYGDDTKAYLIINANPSANEPLVTGSILTVPPDPDTIDIEKARTFQKKINRGVETGNEINLSDVKIKIEGNEFSGWDNIVITRSIDSFDQVTFTTPFNIKDKPTLRIFEPFKFKTITLFVNNELLFTGVMVDISPQVSASQKSLSISCYALPAVLNDCNMPSSVYPIQFINSNLQEIALIVTRAFGLGLQFRGVVGPVFEPMVTCGIDKKVLTFLTELAAQRNLVISNNESGGLVFLTTKSDDKTIASFEEGVSPMIAITPDFDGQGYYSSITGIASTKLKLEKPAKFIIDNPYLNSAFRPFSYKIKDGDNSNLKISVKSKLGRMFANIASYTMTVPTWRDSKNILWEPGTFVDVFAPSAMIYEQSKFMIRSVSYKINSKKIVSSLNLILPGSLNGEIPNSLPWQL